ncbi:MAG: glycosyltransferase [Candidatus Eisenbacteria bacterium]
MPRVSVVIATYNRAALLEEALASVLRQSYQDYEIVVADDGSSDDTAERVAKHGRRARHLSLVHSGKPSIARNAAVRSASGEYLAFLDSDDLWEPLKLERQIELLESDSSYVMAYCDALFLDRDGRLLWRHAQRERLREGRVFGSLLGGNFIPLPTVVARSGDVRAAGAFEEWLTIGEDWHLWMKLAARGRVGCVKEPLCRVRVLPGGITTDRTSLFEDAVKVLRDVETRFPAECVRHRGQLKRGRARVLSMLGRNYLFAGRTAEARRVFSEALRNFPPRWDALTFLAMALLGRRAVLALRSVKKKAWP